MDPTAGLYCPNHECPDRLLGGTIPEFRPGTTVCPTCETALEVGPPPVDDMDDFTDGVAREALDGIRAGDYVVAFRSRMLPESDMVAALLEEHGIPHTRLVLTAGGVAVSIGLRATQPGATHLVVVPASAADTARDLMESTFGPDARNDDFTDDADDYTDDTRDSANANEPLRGGVAWIWRLVAIALLSGVAYVVFRTLIDAGS